ncbi:MAG TPA: universal stress protein [Asticcacaulis sp.]|nr:universal stress protein [Asticcacaulis sp.]
MTFPHRFASILCLFQGEMSELNALGIAMGLARRQRAHLRILHISRPPMSLLDPLGAGAVAGAIGGGAVIDQLIRDDEREIAVARRHVTDCIGQHAMPLCVTEQAFETASAPSALFTPIDDFAPPAIARFSAGADIIITVRLDSGGLTTESGVLPALLATRKPLLFAPPAVCRPVCALFEPRRVTIAWDGGSQAQRAMEASLSILTGAEHVSLIHVEENSDRAPALREAQIYLRKQGVTADIRHYQPVPSTGAALLRAAADDNANLLVMGAYSHNRLAEAVFGGASRHVLRHADLPVLMTH